MERFHQDTDSGPAELVRDLVLLAIFVWAGVLLGGCGDEGNWSSTVAKATRSTASTNTFGDEAYWTRTLRLNEAIQAALDPSTALSLGLKVDAEALPEGLLETADLSSPATTVALIGPDAVVSVRGTVDRRGNLVRVGVTCALCHSRVDDSVMPGIGARLDGYANRDLDPGAIIALSPAFADDTATLEVLRSWGPGRYDPRWSQDGINAPVLIPPIYGLDGVPLETDITEYRFHEPEETGMDPLHADRSATQRYRTTPLRGLQDHPPYFHDGSAATLEEVVDHYEGALGLGLDAGQRSDLVEYLRSL